jgi:hypothetical protein
VGVARGALARPGAGGATLIVADLRLAPHELPPTDQSLPSLVVDDARVVDPRSSGDRAPRGAPLGQRELDADAHRPAPNGG